MSRDDEDQIEEIEEALAEIRGIALAAVLGIAIWAVLLMWWLA